MVPEPVLSAARKVEFLLAQEGTSPEVVEALRRAAAQLAAVAVGGGRDAEVAALGAASRELGACVALMVASEFAADRELVQDTAKTQRSIDRLLRPAKAPAAPAGQAGAPAAPAGQAGARPVAGRVPAAETLLMFGDRGAAGSGRDRAAAPVARPVFAPPAAEAPRPTAPTVSPPPPSHIPPRSPASALPPAAPPPGFAPPPSSATPPGFAPAPTFAPPLNLAPPPRPAASPRPAAWPRPTGSSPARAPIASLPPKRRPIPEERVQGARLLEGILARLSGDYDRRAHRLDDDLLRWDRLAELDAPLARHAMVLDWMGEPTVDAIRQVIAQADDDARPALSRALETAAPKDERVAPERLLAALDDPDDAVATRAALTLAWTGGPEQAASLLARARATASPGRTGALLFASVALGSAAALAEVRARVDGNDELDPRLIEALAVAGDDADAERLLQRAAKAGPHAARAALAVGHLGSAAATVELTKLLDPIGPRLIDGALSLTFGEVPPGHRPPTFAGRLLRGRPWSVEQAVARLSAPDEPVRSRERLALDLAVRTGIRPPLRYDRTAQAAVQARATAAFRATFASEGALRAGRWHYFGGPVPRI